jgi:hypothetical protein
MTLSAQRRFVHPRERDDWAAIAARELPDVSREEAVSRLQSWNLHVFMRPAAPAGSPRENNPILPSDVIFVEPPRAGATEQSS